MLCNNPTREGAVPRIRVPSSACAPPQLAPVACPQVGVSMVLAFMVLWDLPNIHSGVDSLKSSRISAVYSEVAPVVGVFGTLFGKALQAQVI